MAGIKFGASGNSLSFKETNGHTKDVPAYLVARGLDCYEVSFGRGVNMLEDTARELAPIFRDKGIEISAHCPYYINLATEEDDKAINNIGYIVNTMRRVIDLGGNRSVFHPGAPKKMDRREAMNLAISRLDLLLGDIYAEELDNHKLAIETMGKAGQLGDSDEIIEFCSRDKMLYPCIDFGHVNAREQGSLKTKEDYRILIDKFINGLGLEKINDMHVHFSKIEYTAKGEVKHLTFEDNIYGPEFEPLLEVLYDYKLSPYIVCESCGTQAEDAMAMKKYWKMLNNTNKI